MGFYVYPVIFTLLNNSKSVVKGKNFPECFFLGMVRGDRKQAKSVKNYTKIRVAHGFKNPPKTCIFSYGFQKSHSATTTFNCYRCQKKSHLN